MVATQPMRLELPMNYRNTNNGTLFEDIVNTEACLNCMIGSQVTVILVVNGWILLCSEMHWGGWLPKGLPYLEENCCNIKGLHPI